MAHFDQALDRIQCLLEDAVAGENIPGAVAVVGRQSEIYRVFQAGFAQTQGGPKRLMSQDAIFDMASLTKVFVTLPLIMLLAQAGLLSLQDRVVQYLPEFAENDKAIVTISQLLSHSGGLVAHREYFKQEQGYEAVLAKAMAEPLEYRPGQSVIYSDLGYMMLGEIVRRTTGQTLQQAAFSRIFSPLAMNETQYRPDATLSHRIAATEVMPNGRAKAGIVHDDNTQAMGGESGHAGLFSTARDAARYLMEWTNPGPQALLSPAIKKSALTLKTPNTGGARGWGWVLRGDPHDCLGDFWPATGISHTGYTGTSAAFDSTSHIWAILLTNRVHFGRQNDISSLRRRFHNLVMTAIPS
ncbi:MAG: serine hydrolase domain-containing protein [Sulfobacillus sp.]